MANVSYNNIVECVNSGIEKAVKDHLKLTNEYTELSYAPEYFLTVNIASELKKLSAAFVYLEEAMGKSQDTPRKKATEEWGKNKRYDIVVRTSDTLPYAAIEVKNRVYDIKNRIIDDFKRISFAVKSDEEHDEVFKMGVFAFYSVFDDTNSQSANKKSVIELYSNLEEELDKYRGSAKLNREMIEPKSYSYDRNTVWGGGCLVLSSA